MFIDTKCCINSMVDKMNVKRYSCLQMIYHLEEFRRKMIGNSEAIFCRTLERRSHYGNTGIFM